MTSDTDGGGGYSHSFGNASRTRGFSLGHFGTIVAASLCTGIVMRFIDHSDNSSAQITAAAGMAKVETELTELKIEVDRLLERPTELTSEHTRDIDEIKASEARDIQRLEARLDQLEQRNTGRR